MLKSVSRESLQKHVLNSPLNSCWLVCLIFSLIHIVVSIAVAATNSQIAEGSASASFAALWSSILVIFFCINGSSIVFFKNNSPFMFGFVIGLSFFLAEIFLVLTSIFFSYASHAQSNKLITFGANTAMGLFCFFNIFIYLAWGWMLINNRSTILNFDTSKIDVATGQVPPISPEIPVNSNTFVIEPPQETIVVASPLQTAKEVALSQECSRKQSLDETAFKETLEAPPSATGSSPEEEMQNPA